MKASYAVTGKREMEERSTDM